MLSQKLLEESKEIHSRMMMMFTKDTFEQSLVRSNSIMETLASDPVLKSIKKAESLIGAILNVDYVLLSTPTKKISCRYYNGFE